MFLWYSVMWDTMERSFTAKIILLGRITIPKATREVLGLEVGDYVDVTVTPVREIESDQKLVESVGGIQVEA